MFSYHSKKSEPKKLHQPAASPIQCLMTKKQFLASTKKFRTLETSDLSMDLFTLDSKLEVYMSEEEDIQSLLNREKHAISMSKKKKQDFQRFQNLQGDFRTMRDRARKIESKRESSPEVRLTEDEIGTLVRYNTVKGFEDQMESALVLINSIQAELAEKLTVRLNILASLEEKLFGVMNRYGQDQPELLEKLEMLETSITEERAKLKEMLAERKGEERSLMYLQIPALREMVEQYRDVSHELDATERMMKESRIDFWKENLKKTTDRMFHLLQKMESTIMNWHKERTLPETGHAFAAHDLYRFSRKLTGEHQYLTYKINQHKVSPYSGEDAYAQITESGINETEDATIWEAATGNNESLRIFPETSAPKSKPESLLSRPQEAFTFATWIQSHIARLMQDYRGQFLLRRLLGIDSEGKVKGRALFNSPTIEADEKYLPEEKGKALFNGSADEGEWSELYANTRKGYPKIVEYPNDANEHIWGTQNALNIYPFSESHEEYDLLSGGFQIHYTTVSENNSDTKVTLFFPNWDEFDFTGVKIEGDGNQYMMLTSMEHFINALERAVDIHENGYAKNRSQENMSVNSLSFKERKKAELPPRAESRIYHAAQNEVGGFDFSEKYLNEAVRLDRLRATRMGISKRRESFRRPISGMVTPAVAPAVLLHAAPRSRLRSNSVEELYKIEEKGVHLAPPIGLKWNHKSTLDLPTSTLDDLKHKSVATQTDPEDFFASSGTQTTPGEFALSKETQAAPKEFFVDSSTQTADEAAGTSAGEHVREKQFADTYFQTDFMLKPKEKYRVSKKITHPNMPSTWEKVPPVPQQGDKYYFEIPELKKKKKKK
ncbi:MAG: hypothetical protein MI784_05175 [Cytophagales bacterium]|nr:hypothetical protein [Cytophagales bacterium]